MEPELPEMKWKKYPNQSNANAEIEKKYFGVLTKLFNVARFASFFEVPKDLDSEPENLACEDKWILSEFSNISRLISRILEGFGVFLKVFSRIWY